MLTRATFLRRAGLATAATLAASALPACARRNDEARRAARAGRLLRSIGADVGELDPALGSGQADYHVLSALFEGLVVEDSRTGQPAPALAQRWDVTPDGLTYTFHLRPEARWSNGDPVTAADFVAAWRRVLTPALGSENAHLLYLLEGAEAVHRSGAAPEALLTRAVDARTLRVALAHPAPYFLALLAHQAFYPVHLASITTVGDPAARGTAWARPGTLVGNGPFVLRSRRPGQEIVVERAATYHGAAGVRLQGITFFAFDSVDAEERAYRAGQLHVTDALPVSRLDAWRREAPDQLRIDPMLGTYFYRFNTLRPPFTDPRVRRALALAVDRTALVERVLRGGQLPAAGFVPPGTAGYAAPAGFANDFDAARALLAEAGFPGGRGLPPFDILFNTSENHRVIAEAVQAMWRRELGIDARLLNMENTSVLAARRAGEFQVLRSSWIGDYIDPDAFLKIFAGGAGNNYTGWSDSTYDQLLFTAARTGEPATRLALLRSAEERLLAAAPIVPLYHYTHVHLVHPAVRGWHPSLLDRHPYTDVALEA